MKASTAAVLGFLWVASARAEAPATNTMMIVHAPITTVLRGQPAHVAAEIKAGPGTTVTSVFTFVRITDVGKPMPYRMSAGGSDGGFATDIPVSLIRGVNRFWYHIHAADAAGGIADTPWYPVNIIDGANPGDGGGGAAGAWTTRKTALVAGGLLLLGGGGAAIIAANDDDGHKQDAPDTGGGAAPPPKKDNPKPDSSDHTSSPPPVTPCVVTGSEQAYLVSGTDNPFDAGTPLQFYVCGACTNASIHVVGSWGSENTVGPYNNASCDPGTTIPLGKPRASPPANSQTIEIYSNGSLIFSMTWPSSDWF